MSNCFKPTNILRGKMVHLKDKPPKDKQSNSVYWISCATPGCGDTYVGETNQSLRARIKQHRRSSSNEAQNSAVYNHCNENTEQFFNPDEVILLEKNGGLSEDLESPFGKDWSIQQSTKRWTAIPTFAHMGPGDQASSPPSCPWKSIRCLMKSSGTGLYVAKVSSKSNFQY